MEFANKIAAVAMGLVLFISCENHSESGENVFIEANPLFLIKNSEGQNFLESINTEQIGVFYKKNNALTPIGEWYASNSSGTLDNPNGYAIINEQPVNEKMIRIFCYYGGNESKGSTYVKWNDSDIDTISYNIIRHTTGSISIDSLRFNNVLTKTNNQYRSYEILKP